MSLFRVSAFCLSLPLVSALTLPCFAEGWDFAARAPSVDQPGHKEWAWDGDRRLAIGLPAVVHYQRGGTPGIVITGPQEALRHVRVGEGHIASDGEGFWNWSGNETLEVTVRGMPLDHIALGGSGKLLLGHLDQDTLQIDIGGSGTASAEGRVDHLRLTIGGSGRLDFGQVASADAKVTIGGSGNVTIAPRNEATVVISGSGMVRMQTRPAHLHSTIAGSGQILLADKDGSYSEAGPRIHGLSRFGY